MPDMESENGHIKSKAQKKRYWILQLFGWFALMFIEIFNFTFFIRGEFHWRYLYSFGVFSLIGIFSTHFYKTFFIKPSTFDKGLGKVWSKALLDVVLISLLMVILGRLVSISGQFSILKVPITESLRVLGPQFMNIARYVVVWIVIYYLYHILLRNNELQKSNLEAENRAKITELELLKTQLNPHFLFQCLSSIKAMVLKDKEMARDGIIKLSELLRYSLNYEKNSLVGVQEELAELNKYIALEKLRLGPRFQFKMEVEDGLFDQKIPTAALLNLVENAIRNEVENHEEGGFIHLSGKFENGKITFILKGNSAISQQQVAMTKGIENLKIRLQKIFGQDAELTLGVRGDQYFTSQLTIPKSIYI
jgi:two-component system, LytTR family, sensor kinase